MFVCLFVSLSFSPQDSSFPSWSTAPINSTIPFALFVWPTVTRCVVVPHGMSDSDTLNRMVDISRCQSGLITMTQ